MYKPRRKEPTIVYTPLPSRDHTEEAGERSDVASREPAAKSPASDPYLRAENEDDDGYDPYSDRRDEPPLFEQSPWD